MTTPTPECPVCRVRMQDGYVIDAGHHGQVGRTQWAEGVPDKRWLQGLKISGRKLDTVAFRCPKCGWLIWFAPEPASEEA